jgi:hypothetical protein
MPTKINVGEFTMPEVSKAGLENGSSCVKHLPELKISVVTMTSQKVSGANDSSELRNPKTTIRASVG